MSSSSPFMKKAKSRGNIRQRESTGESSGSPLASSSVTADDLDKDGEEEEMSMSPMAMAKARKKDKEKKKSGISGSSSGKSRLSFGGGGEEEVPESEAFVPKKSKLSQSISLQQLAPASPIASPLASSSYSSAYLNELKANTPTRLTGRSRIDADIEGDMDVDDPDELQVGLSRAARNKYGDVEMLDTTAGIPDEAHIAAAKAKRKAAFGVAASNGEEDYISLAPGAGKLSVYDGDQGPHPESRLQREDDDLGEGDEDLAEYTEADQKLALGRDANKIAARRLKNEMLEAIDDKETGDMGDEDEEEWERAQASRANLYGTPEPSNKEPTKSRYRPARVPAVRPIPTVSAASSQIQASLGLVQSATNSIAAQIEATERDKESLATQETDLREEVGRVEAKKEWVEEFRGWVETLGGFLEEKMPLLEEIEADNLHHYGQRDTIISKRRVDDDTDDLALFLGVAPEAVTEEEEEVDELGRVRRKVDNTGPQSGVRRYRRQDRDSRRARRRSVKPPAGDDGFSTDSSLGEGDAADYAAAKSTLGRRVATLSADVKAEDFKNPSVGLAKRFSDWRDKFPEDYSGTWAGLAMVQAWEYWARCEMIGWEPTRSKENIDDFRWLHDIQAYQDRIVQQQRNPDEDMDLDEPELEANDNLVPVMTASVVAPMITKAFDSGAYDVYSKKQTEQATLLVGYIGDTVGTEKPKYRAMLKAVLTLFLKHIDALASLIFSVSGPGAIPPPAFDPASRIALSSFINRRIKLMVNLLKWKSLATDEVLQLVDKLVVTVFQPCLMKSWDSGGRELAAKVLTAARNGNLSDQAVYFLQNGPIRGSR